MRQSHQKSRSRNRGRKTQNPLSRNFESNGPDVKIRGNASHIADKYSSLARDALSNGDTVMAENYLQHAEHYNRIIASVQVQNSSKTEESSSLNGKGANNPAEPEKDSDAEGNPDATAENAGETAKADEKSQRQSDDEKGAPRKRSKKESEETKSAKESSGRDEPSDATESSEHMSEDAASLPQSITGEIAAENN